MLCGFLLIRNTIECCLYLMAVLFATNICKYNFIDPIKNGLTKYLI